LVFLLKDLDIDMRVDIIMLQKDKDQVMVDFWILKKNRKFLININKIINSKYDSIFLKSFNN